MTQVPPSPILPIDEEKRPRIHDGKADIETGVASVVDDEKVLSSSDGDDALKLAGTHARHFDEKYNARLRRKIVSCLPRKSFPY
jgi:ACS family allantoate permease-like MFS transporter